MDRTLLNVQKHNLSSKHSFPDSSLNSSSPASLIEIPSLNNQEDKCERNERMSADSNSKNNRDFMHNREDNYSTHHLNVEDDNNSDNQSKAFER